MNSIASPLLEGWFSVRMGRAAGLRSSRCGEWGGDDQEAASSLFSRGRSERGGCFVASIALVHDLAGHHRPLGRRVFSGGLSKRHALPRRPASQGFFATIFPILRTRAQVFRVISSSSILRYSEERP